MAQKETLPQAWEEMSSGGTATAARKKDSNAVADALEHKMIRNGASAAALGVVHLGRARSDRTDPGAAAARQAVVQGPDPRLKPMPEKPTLMDFFTTASAPTNHLLQSANSRARAAIARRSFSPACCTISASSASSAPIMAIGARSSSSPMSMRK